MLDLGYKAAALPVQPSHSHQMPAKPSTESLIRLRVIVHNPLSGVAVAMQVGRDELQPPKPASKTKLTFSTEAKVGRTQTGDLRLTGPAIQGPTGSRFIYVNWGKRAGQHDTHWDRRAKIMLGAIDWRLVNACQAKDAVLETEIQGIGKDGGPWCATVPLIGGWRIV